MFRALFLYLLGATFEVRLINTKSGKDVPGTKLYKGSYWKCRKVVRDKYLKYGQMIRLQAVTVLEWDINSDAKMVDVTDVAESPQFTPSEIKGTFGIAEVTPAVVEKFGDHDCNAEGAYEYDEPTGNYVPTCSICGQLINIRANPQQSTEFLKSKVMLGHLKIDD